MKAGAVAEATIRARHKWNHTGIALTTGQTYNFEASGCWTDLVISHGPSGDPSDSAYMRFFERWRRVPSANWFAVIGAVDCIEDTAFVIGAGCTRQIQTSGELTCFANDVRGFYWNNFGAVHLRVTRIS